jgi:hypothetical protein
MATHPIHMIKADSNAFKNPMAAELTKNRIQARRKRRLTYDCMSAIVKGAVVVCKEGHKFLQMGRRGGQGQGLSLLSVLRGRSSGVCQNCHDFDQEITE